MANDKYDGVDMPPSLWSDAADFLNNYILDKNPSPQKIAAHQARQNFAEGVTRGSDRVVNAGSGLLDLLGELANDGINSVDSSLNRFADEQYAGKVKFDEDARYASQNDPQADELLAFLQGDKEAISESLSGVKNAAVDTTNYWDQALGLSDKGAALNRLIMGEDDPALENARLKNEEYIANSKLEKAAIMSKLKSQQEERRVANKGKSDVALEKLVGASGKGTQSFVSVGDERRSNAASDGKGQFSKHSSQSEESRLTQKLLAAGMHPMKVKLLNLAKSEKDPETARQLAGLADLQGSTPRSRLSDMLMKLASKGDVKPGTLEAFMVMQAKIEQMDDAEIQQLFPNKE